MSSPVPADIIVVASVVVPDIWGNAIALTSLLVLGTWWLSLWEANSLVYGEPGVGLRIFIDSALLLTLVSCVTSAEAAL
jgi:hypothetical protein